MYNVQTCQSIRVTTLSACVSLGSVMLPFSRVLVFALLDIIVQPAMLWSSSPELCNVLAGAGVQG